MVKICPKCKTAMPPESIHCIKCGYTNLVLICPKCKKILPPNSKKCPICGDMELSISESSKGHNKIASIQGNFILKRMFSILIILVIVGCSFFAYKNVLWGDDKIAYDLVIMYANTFKDPPSIRIRGGVAGQNEDGNLGKYAFLKISARNGFGGASIGYYHINEEDISDLEDEREFWAEIGPDLENSVYNMMTLCEEQDRLNLDKINNALQRKFG
jgi:RNA polymerase subunit RPABC4/transcription elongation factor Spt4